MTVPMNYVDAPDVPEGQTLVEWRRARCPVVPRAPRRGLRALLRRLF